MDQLRDIVDLAPVSAWPLALGWWIVITLVAVLLITAAVYSFRQLKYYRSWQGRAFRELTRLEDNIDQPEILATLSSEIRKIAINTRNRQACAGLTSSNWLSWLQANDPYNFKWTECGKILISHHYSPEVNVETEEVKSLIQASKRWVQKC